MGLFAFAGVGFAGNVVFHVARHRQGNLGIVFF